MKRIILLSIIMFIGFQSFSQKIVKLRTRGTKARIQNIEGKWGDFMPLIGINELIVIDNRIPKITIYTNKELNYSAIKSYKDTTTTVKEAESYVYECIDDKGEKCNVSIFYPTNRLNEKVVMLIKYAHFQYVYEAKIED